MSDYQLHPVGAIRPLLIRPALGAAALAEYLAYTKSATALVSATFDATLTTLRREYANRKSYTFDPNGANSGALYSAMIAAAKAHAPTLWANTFPVHWAVDAPQGLKYIAGGSFVAHADDRVAVLVKDGTPNGTRHIVVNQPQRQIVIILYLNGDYTGGELYFPTLGKNGGELAIKPKAGEMLLFGGDNRYLHGVHEVLSGERYCLTLWLTPLPVRAVETVADIEARLYDIRASDTPKPVSKPIPEPAKAKQPRKPRKPRQPKQPRQPRKPKTTPTQKKDTP